MGRVTYCSSGMKVALLRCRFVCVMAIPNGLLLKCESVM